MPCRRSHRLRWPGSGSSVLPWRIRKPCADARSTTSSAFLSGILQESSAGRNRNSVAYAADRLPWLESSRDRRREIGAATSLRTTHPCAQPPAPSKLGRRRRFSCLVDTVRVKRDVILDLRHRFKRGLISPHCIARAISARWNAVVGVALVGQYVVCSPRMSAAISTSRRGIY
jgi:hypothetical protein